MKHIILRYVAEKLKKDGFKVSEDKYSDYSFKVTTKKGIHLDVRLAKVDEPYIIDIVLIGAKNVSKCEEAIKDALRLAIKVDKYLSNLFHQSISRRIRNIISSLGLLGINISLGQISLSPACVLSEEQIRGEKVERGTVAVNVGLYTRLIIK